jgi:hypothetical protein
LKDASTLRIDFYIDNNLYETFAGERVGERISHGPMNSHRFNQPTDPGKVRCGKDVMVYLRFSYYLTFNHEKDRIRDDFGEDFV